MEKTKDAASIGIKPLTKKAFDAAKKEGKSADEFIVELLKSYREHKPSDFKNLESKCKALEEENAKLKNERVSQPQPATSEVPTTDTSTETSKVAEPTAPIEPVKVGGQQCHYYTFNPKKQKVECLRKYAKENVIDLFTQQICDYCWSLDPYKKYPIPNSQITDEQVSKEEPAPNSPSPEQKSESKLSSENKPWTPTEQRAVELAYEKQAAAPPVYRDRIVEKPIYIEKIVEKPIEKIVEKIIYTDRRTGLEIPYFMSMANVEDELADRRKRMAKTEEKCEQTRQKLRKMDFEEYQEWVGHPITQEEYHEMKGDVDA
jgi:hypothetical protein